MTDDSPDPALAMRASDADRERVADVLRDAYAEGRLSPDEHQHRLSTVYAATTFGELVPVLTDLPVPPGTLPVTESIGVELVSRPPASHALSIRPDLEGQSDGDAIAVFGGFERRGSWVVPSRLSAVCVFAGGELDLSQALLTSQVTVIRVRCFFGGLDITVPEGMVVQNSARAVFGGNRSPVNEQPHGAPVLRIEGMAVFGGIDTHWPRRSKGRADCALPR
jgi:hypothetical protein